MPTFLYSPGIRVFIETEEKGVLDVSEDITEFSLVRRTDGVSTFDFAMNNARRKYDGVFAPNDRIVVMMKRVTWLRVFTGYLNSAPLRTAWPQVVSLTASDSLKRLQYWFWDQYNAETQTMVANALSEAGLKGNPDGAIINVILTILKEVVGWPESKVHIGRIPEDWFDIARKIAERVDAWAEEADDLLAEFMRTLGAEGVAAGRGVGGAISGVLTPGNFGGTDLAGEQLRNAEVVYSVGMQMGMSEHDIVIGLSTALQESGLVVKTQAESDRDSAGIFQQRPSQGWGSVKQVMDPTYASRKFFTRLKNVRNRDKMQVWQAAYEVQACAEEYAREYQKWVPEARALVAQMKNAVPATAGAALNALGSALSFGLTTATGGVGAGVTGQHLLAAAIDMNKRNPNMRYIWGGGHSESEIRANPPRGLDCSGFVSAALLRATGKVKLNTSATWSSACRRITAKQAMKTPGALLFRDGHVEISMGNGRQSIGAHSSKIPQRQQVGVVSTSASEWTHGGLVPGISYAGMIGTGGGPAGVVDAGGTLLGGTKQWPVAAKEITTRYKKPGSWAAGYHTGIDFGNANTGDRVEAVCDGRVIGAGVYGDYGNCVRVKTGDLVQLYAHLSAISVNDGDQVKMGDKLGEVGNTGRSFGAHLHFEVREAPYDYGDDVDPKQFIEDGIMSAGGFAQGAFGGGGGQTWQPSAPASELPGYDPTDPIDKLFGDNPWAPMVTTDSQQSILANALSGARALMNDQPLLPYIKNLFASTMRSFCSAPNGDLIGWFPDYYGLWDTAAKLRVEPIEIQDFNVIWTDDYFVTHQFALAGLYNGLDLSTGSVQTTMRPSFETVGIANIDIPEMMYALFGIEPDSHEDFAQWVYKRFGARPDYQQMEGLVGPKAEFFAALWLFMRQWAYQYNADVPVTFMPEAWPGMLLQIPRFDFQAYITTVTHTGRFGEGGGFSTQINIAAPAYMPRKGKADRSHALFGLPQAGKYAAHERLGPPPQDARPQQAGKPIPAADNPKLDQIEMLP